MDEVTRDKVQTPTEAYLSESAGASRQKVLTVLELVAGFQGIGDWRQAQWERITEDDLPLILARLHDAFSDPVDVKAAISIIKGVARCAWRQKLMSGQQLAMISKWKGDH